MRLSHLAISRRTDRSTLVARILEREIKTARLGEFAEDLSAA
jgi:hypothetical protein